ncbi:hypothetical protein [Rummeliibacillus sp. SL167]|uniref:hypothetical protein n=1 Tax=Rummeliibacillus sp. SL167 TaxID=2579792 RepID=UPI0011B64781|nr:hypothetical protein [Rummeliibacillus sp. SL167]
MRPIGLGGQDVGPSDFATGRGAFHLSSSSSIGDEENPPLMAVSLYPALTGSKLPTDGSFTL